MAGGFYGIRSVIADRNKHLRTGKVVTATLKIQAGPNKNTTVPYANIYVWPNTEVTGAGGQGRAWTGGRVTLYRMGEAYAPATDDTLESLEVNGVSTNVRINSVQPRLNADEALSFAVYDLDVATT